MLGLRNPQFCMWTTTPTSWHKNHLFNLDLLRIVLAISRAVSFFISTTPFCWGVLGAAYFLLPPYSSQNSSNPFKVSSPPWLDLRNLIFKSVSFSIILLKALNKDNRKAIRHCNVSIFLFSVVPWCVPSCDRNHLYNVFKQ